MFWFDMANVASTQNAAERAAFAAALCMCVVWMSMLIPLSAGVKHVGATVQRGTTEEAKFKEQLLKPVQDSSSLCQWPAACL